MTPRERENDIKNNEMKNELCEYFLKINSL